jgi:protoporphyrinogen oxidase
MGEVRAEEENSVAVIGAGPAGLTAAYTLLKKSGGRARVTVLEADPRYVGGLSRTVEYKGFHFDIGGHRFFSKSQEIEDLWTEILPGDMLTRPRQSRIYYRGKFFSYPLRPFEALVKLGLFESARCVASYARARLRPDPAPRSFEDWASDRFGRRLYTIFFKTYTEKVWGMSCRDISADWAAQRLKGLSLSSALKNFLLPRRLRGRERRAVVKTLIDTFRYPRLGPGMMWEACAARVRESGGEVFLGRRVTGCEWDASARLWTVRSVDAGGAAHETRARHVVSSAPLRQLARALRPQLSEAARGAAGGLKYRDFLTVVLILRDRGGFPDNWIYIHDPAVRVGRIQNFKAWSPEMVPDPALSCYGLEYFCFEGDGLWSSTDEELLGLTARELEQTGLARASDVSDGCVVRQPKAYPVYDDDYAAQVAAVRAEIEERFPTLHLAGRNGMHKYNNQDHAMMTGILCAENILAGRRVYDVWRVNQDAEYHEEGDADQLSAASGLRLVPARVKPSELSRTAGGGE